MRDVYNNGGVVGGTSAGCVGLSVPVMVSGGMSWNALRYGAYPDGEGGRDDLEYDQQGALGFLDGYVLDSHFRWVGGLSYCFTSCPRYGYIYIGIPVYDSLPTQ